MSYEVLVHEKTTWINITSPTKEDLERLSIDYPQFHPLALEDCLSPHERPKIDEFEDHLFVIMQFPRWEKQQRLTHAEEVDMFVGANFLVTTHSGQLKPLKQLFQTLATDRKAREDAFTKGGGGLLHMVIDKLVDYLLPVIQRVENKIRDLEKEVFDKGTSDVVKRITFMRRDLLTLKRIIKPQSAVVEKLEKVTFHFLPDELQDYFDDILDHLRTISDAVAENTEVIEGLSESADTLASLQINEAMRTLTVLSVIMLPLTLVAGIFGMNVPIPLQKSGVSLWMILIGMGAISVGMLAYFRSKNWI